MKKLIIITALSLAIGGACDSFEPIDPHVWMSYVPEEVGHVRIVPTDGTRGWWQFLEGQVCVGKADELESYRNSSYQGPGYMGQKWAIPMYSIHYWQDIGDGKYNRLDLSVIRVPEANAMDCIWPKKPVQ